MRPSALVLVVCVPLTMVACGGRVYGDGSSSGSAASGAGVGNGPPSATPPGPDGSAAGPSVGPVTPLPPASESGKAGAPPARCPGCGAFEGAPPVSSEGGPPAF